MLHFDHNRKLLFTLFVLWIATILSGCNLFESVDTSLNARSDLDRIEEGNIALQAGDFTRALEIFSDARILIGGQDSVTRGYAEAIAGLAGFRVLSLLDSFQNGIGPYDRGEVLFRCRGQITSIPGLTQACTELRSLHDPERPDHITRGLARIALAVHQVLQKYDTNRDKQLTSADYIDFDTNDATTGDWPTLYADLITVGGAGGTLEDAYFDLITGFNGRGSDWTFISPLSSQKITGTFTEVNRHTIQAVGNLIESLKLANTYYHVDEASFTTALRLLDGSTP